MLRLRCTWVVFACIAVLFVFEFSIFDRFLGYFFLYILDKVDFIVILGVDCDLGLGLLVYFII